MNLPALLFSPLTGQVYICTRGVTVVEGKHSYFRADKQFDATEVFDELAKDRRAFLRRRKRRLIHFTDDATPKAGGAE